MYKKYFILFIPLIALIAIGILSGNGYSLGHYKDRGGPGGAIVDCNICHDFVNGIYGGGDPYGTPTPPPAPPSGYNLRWVKTSINSRDVLFTSFSSPPGTLADGNNGLLDGACEVCHHPIELFIDTNGNNKWDPEEELTDYNENGLCDPDEPYTDVDGNHQCDPGTKYHNYSGDATNHYDGNNCTTCHQHFMDDITNYFEPSFVGNQSHYTHFDDPKGPVLGTSSCYYNVGGCHNPSSFTRFGAENQPLSSTTVCDNCHSPNGAYPGTLKLNDPVIGAKANWQNGIYEPKVPPAAWPSNLKEGKENWCATCHDDIPAVINTVSAPNVMGDNVSYGYNKTGHGVQGDPPITCVGPLPFGCHATISKFCSINKSKVCIDDTDCPTGQTCNYAPHIDGNEQTYKASLNNYRSGYRLAEDMSIPRDNGQYGPSAFKLCFSCHFYTVVFGDASNFRNESDIPNIPDKQLHDEHVGMSARDTLCWDSDWDGSCTATDPECVDSAMSCTACHNVHGSPCIMGGTIVSCTEPIKAPMIRHGELINKVPALDFRWYKEDGITETTSITESRYGKLVCGQSPDVTLNGICWGCHGRGDQIYKRVPYKEGIIINKVWVTNWSDASPPAYPPGGQIRYHVQFQISGPNVYYIVASGRAKSTSGASWVTKLSKNDNLAATTYDWTWDEHVPTGATPGSTAKLIITLYMYDFDGGSLISYAKKNKAFNIQ